MRTCCIAQGIYSILCSDLNGKEIQKRWGFPGGSDGKESACNAGVLGLGWEDALEEGMATHASILAWRIPRTEEPGGLPSMGSQRVGHTWVTHMFTFTGGREAGSRWRLGLPFVNDSGDEHLWLASWLWLHLLWKKMSFHVVYTSFNWALMFLLLSHKDSSYILDPQPLSDLWFADIFSHL